MFRKVQFLFFMMLPSALIAQAPAQPLPRASFIATMDGEYGKIDVNKDGQVTRAEVDAFQKRTIAAQVLARQRAIFATLDSDRNGQLTPQEFYKVPITPPRNNPDTLMRFDTNRDGRVTLIEHRTATLANFDRLDIDKDGIVSTVEMKGSMAR